MAVFVFVETELYKAIEKYNNSLNHRFYEFGHLIIVLVFYELLLAISLNPHVLAYNGVDAWFKFAQKVVPHGTLLISLALIVNWGDLLRMDWMGEKDRYDRKKEREEKKKKGKDFKPIVKKPFRPNWYYFGFMALEGFVYGSLIILFLPWIVSFLGGIADPNLSIPLSLESSQSMRDYLTNFVQDIALAFGAGFYEEIIFRGLLFMLIAWLAKKSKYFKQLKTDTQPISRMKIQVPKYNPKNSGFWLVVSVGTLIYTLSHYLYPFGDEFSIYTIIYRFLFGMIMFYIFVKRQLAIVVWTHVFYDLWYFITL
ncbi:MAG: CPBP family glutamic-type intramembrane protease [Bacteroidia bacterium]